MVQASSAMPADDPGASKVLETTDVSVPSEIPRTSEVTENCLVQSTVNPQISPLPLIRDCAIITRRGGGGGKTRGGASHKIAAKIGGLKVKSLI